MALKNGEEKEREFVAIVNCVDFLKANECACCGNRSGCTTYICTLSGKLLLSYLQIKRY